MPMTLFRATRGRTTVSPATVLAVASVASMPGESGLDGWSRAWTEAVSAARWAASPGAVQTRAPGVGTGSGGAIEESSSLRPSMRSSSSWSTYERYGSEDWSAIV